MRRPKPPSDPENSLLGDLESIRALLESGHDTQAPSVEREAGGSSDVPMLDDVVDGALEVDETPLASRAFAPEGPSGLADETIEALMGDAWRESAERIVRAARESISAASGRWSGTETRSLAETLRHRIDAVLEDWMAEIALGNLDALRRQLLDAIEDEVRRIADRIGAADD